MTWTYRVGRAMGRFVFFCTMRTHVTDSHFAERDGGYVLALTHLSHLEPLAAGIIARRPMDWMTHKEFYKYRVIRWCLDGLNYFRVDRQGVPVSAVRAALRVETVGRRRGGDDGCARSRAGGGLGSVFKQAGGAGGQGFVEEDGEEELKREEEPPVLCLLVKRARGNLPGGGRGRQAGSGA